MKLDQRERFAPRLTLGQTMKLVVAAAFVSLCLTPIMRLALAGAVPWDFSLLGAAVAVPLLCAIAAFPLAREGRAKDRLIRLLLLVSVCAGLAAAAYPLIFPSTIWARTGAVVQTMYFVVALLIGPLVVLLVGLSKRT